MWGEVQGSDLANRRKRKFNSQKDLFWQSLSIRLLWAFSKVFSKPYSVP